VKAPKSYAEVLAALRAAGVAVEKVPGVSEWRADCVRCSHAQALRVIRTPEGPDPVRLWCTAEARALPLADIPTPPADAPVPTPGAPVVAKRSTAWDNLPVLSEKAFYGPIGAYVRALAPHTEASPPFLLGATITTIGAMLGRGPHCLIEGAPHHARFFVLGVGSSATARKGTALYHGVTRVINAVDPDFFKRTHSGLSSAEGLITWVRDGTTDADTPAEKRDAGVGDKRLLVKQGEAAGLFRVLEREGNTLSARLREAWDGDDLQVMTRSAPLKATAPHVCIVAAITPNELARSLKAVEVHNGLANRFMPFWCEREQLLPHGGNADQPEVLDALATLRRAVADSRAIGRVTWSRDGYDWWTEHYAELSSPSAGGMLGTLLARGAPIVQRLALLFAVLDGRRERSAAHCTAALAVWRYIEGSWRALYATADVLSDRARKLLDALNAAGPDGLPRSQCRTKLGSGNIAADDIGAALSELREAGLARPHRQSGRGRTAERWVSMRHLAPVDGHNGQNGREAPQSPADGDHKDHSDQPASVIIDGPPLDLIAADGPPPEEAPFGVLEDLSEAGRAAQQAA
jgi:hypothetical protein